MALVDVVIPVTGPAPGLKEAVESALAQGVRVRVILVDSTGTGAALEAAPDGPRIIKVPAPGTNRAGARNAGIARGASPFVAFLDPDTFWLPGKLTRQLSALRPDVAISCTDYFVFGERGAILRSSSTRNHHPATGRVLGDLLRDNFVQPSSVIIRRTVLEGPEPLDVTLGTGAERDLVYRIAAKHEVVFEPAVLLAVRARETTRDDRIAMTEDLVRVYEKTLGWVEDARHRAAARAELTRLLRDLGWLYSTRDLPASIEAYARALYHGGLGAVRDVVKAPLRRLLLAEPTLHRSAAA
jgi:glycosyltransferase involved in cell wall biosynthesis